MHSLIVFRTCIPGHSIAQFFFFGMILRESPKVTGGELIFTMLLKKLEISGMSTDNRLSAILSKQIFEIRMVSHKIKQINSPLRFTKVVLVCLRLLISVLHSKQKIHYVSIQRKLRNYQSKPEKSQSP